VPEELCLVSVQHIASPAGDVPHHISGVLSFIQNSAPPKYSQHMKKRLKIVNGQGWILRGDPT
jgi:hypothetical protein